MTWFKVLLGLAAFFGITGSLLLGGLSLLWGRVTELSEKTSNIDKVVNKQIDRIKEEGDKFTDNSKKDIEETANKLKDELRKLKRWRELTPCQNLDNLPFRPQETKSFELDKRIPVDASEILLYVNVMSGSHPNRDRSAELVFFTQEGSSSFTMKVFSHQYEQGAWAFNSEHFWLPVTTDRKIWFRYEGERLGDDPRYVVTANIIGYR